MAANKSIEEILKALASVNAGQQPPVSSTPTQQPGAPAYPHPPYPGASQQPYSMPQQAPYGQPPAAAYPGMPYPPTSYSGHATNPPPQPGLPAGVDLSNVKPVSSGTVSIEAAIERAKALAAEKGVAPYTQSPSGGPVAVPYSTGHHGGPSDPRGGYTRRSRSRSPVARRDPYQRDGYNAYRDERRDMPREYGRGSSGPSGGAGRDRGRDRSYSPGPRGRNSDAFSPRGNNGNARERSPPGGGDSSEVIEIESSLVGLIIGRQGENLRRVESETGCRVQFLTPPGDASPYRQCKISGPRAQRAEARTSIYRIIDDSGMGAIARAGLDKGGHEPRQQQAPPPQAASLRENEDSLQIMVPDRTVGLIIGRGGETIRDLQERSGCHINIVGESKSVNGLRPVNLIGPSDAAVMAKNLIMEIVDSDTKNAAMGGAGGAGGPPGAGGGKDRIPRQYDNSRDGGMGHGRPGGGGGKVNDSVYVPSEAVGMIIGKGGETIREMQNTTSCKINVSQSSGPGETEREIMLVGYPDNIANAKRAIEDKVEAVMQRIKNGGSGPGDRGGRGGGRHQRHDDYDSKPYGRSDRDNNPQHQAVPAQQAPAAAAPVTPGAPDPYAQYGGYQNYVALWYSALAANAAGATGAKPDGSK